MATEKRLIDANAIPWEEYYVPDPDSNVQWDYKKELSVLKPVVDQMPTVDAVEVVRCKNCKEKFEYGPNQFCCFLSGMPIDEDDFCSLGSKMDGEEA